MLHAPWWAALVLLGFWLLSNAIVAYTSGWSALARRFRAGAQPDGPRLAGQVARSRSTVMIPTAAGLYLHSHPLVLFHPPLLIPWSLIRYAGGHQFLWLHTRVLDLDGVTTIGVRDSAFREITPYLTDASLATSETADQPTAPK
jgi:hypothetical protein